MEQEHDFSDMSSRQLFYALNEVGLMNEGALHTNSKAHKRRSAIVSGKNPASTNNQI